MKHLIIFCMACILFSCGKEKIIVLPEIQNAKITEVHDVSHAYLFYDVAQPDSLDLNRKNLIITTNWLVNVDKRLTLAQAIPKIQLLQEKKRNAKMHKNENAKNYYTCNDTKIKNLGFVDFTDVIYTFEGPNDQPMLTDSATPRLHITFKGLENIQIINYINSDITLQASKSTFLKTMTSFKLDQPVAVTLHFNKNLLFQDYITLKSKLETLDSEYITVEHNEFIY